MHGPADALAYGVKVTGVHALRRRRRRRHRADRGAGRGRGARRRRHASRCTSGSRWPSGRCSSTPSAGWPARASPSRTGRSGSDDCSEARDPDQARARLGLRQDRARGPRAGPARRRRRARVHRRLGRADRGARHPGHQGRGPHRLPRVPGRPGQDAAPPGARRDPRRPAPRVARAAARRPGRRALRPGGRQPLPVHPDGDVRRRRPTSASSRSTSAVRRWCGRRRRTTRPSRS